MMTILRRHVITAATLLLAFTVPDLQASDPVAQAERAVRAAEEAFAQSMADRDLEAFASFVSEEAVFFAGDQADRGKSAVLQRWSPYFEGETAPFSWAPDVVAVLPSGHLALSSGPVFDPAGTRVATFNSTWRLEEDGSWRVVFDKGSDYCGAP